MSKLAQKVAADKAHKKAREMPLQELRQAHHGEVYINQFEEYLRYMLKSTKTL